MNYRDNLEGSLYLKRPLDKNRFLSQEDEFELLREVYSGDKKALDRLSYINFGLVVHIAQKYCGRGLPLADLVEEGNIGLMKAIEKFDISRGTRFAGYAANWIRADISKAVNEKARMIRLPDHQARRCRRIKETICNSGGRHTPEVIDKISKAERISHEETYLLLDRSREVMSLSDKVVHDSEESENDRTMECFVADERENPAGDAEREMLKEDIRYALSFLPKEGARVLEDRFGLNGNDGATATLEELGIRYGVSRQTVRNREKRALKKLRENPQVRRILSGYLKP